MIIRVAHADDAIAIRRIAERAYAAYVAELGKPPAPMIADFSRHIEEDWVIVAEQEEVVGYAILLDKNGAALLDNIAVDPSKQRLGAGRALVRRIEERAIEIGHQSLELYTNVVMTANVRWYEKLGFVETRRVVEAGFHRVYMKKNLGD